MFWTITIPSICLLLLSSYAIRIFEGPAQARHSLYFWDQMWLVRRRGLANARFRLLRYSSNTL